MEETKKKAIKMLNESFWSKKYQSDATHWDAGEITRPLKEYVDRLEDKDIKILIPGVGRGHELRYLHEQGFKNVFAVDIASEPLVHIEKNIEDFPKSHLMQGDFFKLEGAFDLILEQTFFCALSPELREAYVKKMNTLLSTKGKLVGVLFDFPLVVDGMPPYGGTQEEYILLFSRYMRPIKIERCYNSIKPRADRELFIHIEKKHD